MQQLGQSRPLWEAREYERHFSQFIDEGDRPLLHLSPLVGWMNDPNGFSFYEGRYHLFYQYNPYATLWAPMHWGHAVSEDLVRWEHLPAALAPDMPYDDKGGCFSGSALELPDGRHLLMYTGVAAGGRKLDGTVSERQQQCLAIGDGVDYQKYEGNPVIGISMLPAGADPEHFRDPKIWREEDGSFRCVVATLDAGRSGQILLFSSADGLRWQPEGVLFKNDGRIGTMWECPDLFRLDGKDVLLVSPQDMLPEGCEFHGGNGTICIIGHLDDKTGALVEEGVHTVDHGIDFYATQTILTPDGRRVMVAWMQNWDTISSADPKVRWFGQMTIPRELAVRDGCLLQWPVRELDMLRHDRVAYEGVAFSGVRTLEGVRGRCADVMVTVRSADPNDPYREFTIWLAQDERFHTTLRYLPGKGELKVDRSHCGSRRAILHHRKCVIAGQRDELSLRVVLDRHSCEFFVNGGERCITITIPTDQAADGISFYADGTVVMRVEKYDLTPTGSDTNR